MKPAPKPAPKEDSRLTRFTRICLALPESTRQMMGSHASFLIRKKVFAYFQNNHHGDGIVGINCKVLPGDNAALIASDPARFYMPAYVGSRGWVGLRLDGQSRLGGGRRIGESQLPAGR